MYLTRRRAARVPVALLFLPLLAAVTACGHGTPQAATSGQDVEIASAQSSGPEVSTAPEAACESAGGPESVVIAAFDTTVGGVRQWQAEQVAMDLERAGRPSSEDDGQATWSSELSAATDAVLCYLDGTVNKAPPPTPDGPEPVPFDRAVVAVLEDASVIGVTLGYQDTLPVHAPPS
jgi:hypothetical protein